MKYQLRKAIPIEPFCKINYINYSLTHKHKCLMPTWIQKCFLALAQYDVLTICSVWSVAADTKFQEAKIFAIFLFDTIRKVSRSEGDTITSKFDDNITYCSV